MIPRDHIKRVDTKSPQPQIPGSHEPLFSSGLPSIKNDSQHAYRDQPARSSTDSEDDYKPILRPKVHIHAHNTISNGEALRQIRRRRFLGSNVKPDNATKTVSCDSRQSKCSSSKDRGEGLKPKTKREPLPMCRRALPQSFFKEPKSMNTSSLAGDFYSLLPPLFASENNDVAEERPVTPPNEKGQPQPPKKAHRSTEPDTELLFSLFSHLEEPYDKRLLVKRGRPKKQLAEKPPLPPIRRENDDPCIVDALSDRMFPKLSINNNNTVGSNGSLSSEGPIPIGVIRLNNGATTIEFPAISSEENYSAMLNELVTRM